MWKISSLRSLFRIKKVAGVMPTKIESAPPTSIKTGRVVATKKNTEYEPITSLKGGRVVHTIPKQLKKIRDAQK